MSFTMDHLIVGHAEGRAIQHVIHILVIAAGQKLNGLLKPLGGLAQPFAIGILTKQR